MSNFELIDDYLSNRLKGAEKEAFDKQLQNDPALRSELDLQKQIIEGIRSARAKEIKTMLGKVPVAETVTVDFSVVRMAAGLVAAGVVGAAIYFFATGSELPFKKAATDLDKKTEEIQKQQPAEQDKTEVAPDSNETSNTPETTPAVKEESKKQVTPKQSPKQSEEIKPAEKPKLDVTNPSEELSSDANKNEPLSVRRSDITPSHIQVEMDSSNKKFDFHYQFVDSKLRLYGSFDKSLYEVLEINGDNHAVFLFYKDVYYLLDENQTKIAKLEPIKDASLVSKLREYRKR